MEATIKAAITNALVDLGVGDVAFSVEDTGDLTHGDFASNVAMKAFGPVMHGSFKNQFGAIDHMAVWDPKPEDIKAPRQLAELLKNRLDGQIKGVEKIEVAGPGFLNFHLDRTFFTQTTDRILQAGEQWGKNDTLAGKTYVVEYTDPNPFKAFHIGHLFTNTVGESIARLMMVSGADTKRVCYQGDIGLHVACAIYGMQQLGLTADQDFTAKDLGKAYALGATANKENEAAAAAIRELNKKIYERSDDAINDLYDKGRAVSLADFEEIYKKVGTQFDHYFFESEAGPRGRELVLAHPEIFTESDGARVFAGEEYGLHTRVFVNSEGLPTYEAKELALAKMKEEVFGSYDHSIISTAKEINEYFKVLLKAMSFVYPELAAKTEHIGHGMVRLATGKMSSRTGDVILARNFIAEVAAAARERMAANSAELASDDALVDTIAIGAIKYATLKGDIRQDSVFDTNQALSFEGASGPYLQYTHARIQSVLKKAQAVDVTPTTSVSPDVVYEVERLLHRFPGMVERAAAGRAPHLVTTHLTELAAAFNAFYAGEKIADASDPHAPYKASLAAAVGITLKNGLWILGIAAPEVM